MASTRNVLIKDSDGNIMAANHNGTLKVAAESYIKTKKQNLIDRLTKEVKQLEEVLFGAKENIKILKNLQNQYKRGDVVFHKETGPSLFVDFLIVDDAFYIPEPLPPNLKSGEILVIVQGVDEKRAFRINEIVPYTENVKLLYEAERNSTNE